MKEETNSELKPHWFRGYRDYWTGIGVMIVLYSIIYGATGTHGMSLVLGILMSVILMPIFCGLISGVIFLIAWIFKRNFTPIFNNSNNSDISFTAFEINRNDSLWWLNLSSIL